MARRGRVARRRVGVVRRRARFGANYGAWVLLVAVIVLGVAIWLSTRAGASSSAPPATPTAVPTVPIVPPAPAARIALAERQRLPATTGVPVALHDFQGKTIVLALYSAST